MRCLNIVLASFILSIISISPARASIVIFQPNNAIKSSEINNNFAHIKTLVEDNGFSVEFNSFQNGSIIDTNQFEAEFDKLRSLGMSISPLSSGVIKSQEINDAFAQMLSGISQLNDIPTSSNISFSVNEDGSYTGVVDFVNNTGNISLEITSPASKGIVVVNSGASFTYTPLANLNGTDNFSFRVNDGTHNSNISQASVNINPVNDEPISSDQSLITNEDIDLAISLSSNDIDNIVLAYFIVSGPSSGQIIGTGRDIVYRPNANFNGTDSFTFRAYDGEYYSNTATINITINPINDAPIVNDLNFVIAHNATYSGQLNSTDIDSSTFSYSSFESPVKGSLVLNPNGSFTYTPFVTSVGSDSFKVKSSDGFLTSVEKNINVTINCASSFHEESGSCLSDTRTCTLSSGAITGTGTQTWNGSGYGACTVASCNATYVPSQDNLSCVSENCPISDATYCYKEINPDFEATGTNPLMPEIAYTSTFASTPVNRWSVGTVGENPKNNAVFSTSATNNQFMYLKFAGKANTVYRIQYDIKFQRWSGANFDTATTGSAYLWAYGLNSSSTSVNNVQIISNQAPGRYTGTYLFTTGANSAFIAFFMQSFMTNGSGNAYIQIDNFSVQERSLK